MDRDAVLTELIGYLCEERGERPPALDERQKPDFFRALCNVRPPRAVGEDFLRLQNAYLQAKTAERGIVDVAALSYRDGFALWQGDITRLNADAIVNAGNAALLGCFHPLHGCIDNVIHSNAGVQVRLDLDRLLRGARVPNGAVRVTEAYCLPSRYIFHTVGPIVRGVLTRRHRADLAQCYLACLAEAARRRLGTIAFCCISTGEYRFPRREACAVAVAAAKNFVREQGGRAPRVIWNVFTDEDRQHYERELHR